VLSQSTHLNSPFPAISATSARSCLEHDWLCAQKAWVVSSPVWRGSDCNGEANSSSEPGPKPLFSSFRGVLFGRSFVTVQSHVKIAKCASPHMEDDSPVSASSIGVCRVSLIISLGASRCDSRGHMRSPGSGITCFPVQMR